MSINLLIKERLQLFRHLLSDITNFKQNQSQKEAEIEIPNNIKFTIRDVLSSDNLYSYFEDKNAKALEQLKNNKNKGNTVVQHISNKKTLLVHDMKRSANTSCFNQRSVNSINQFFSSPNESNLVNLEVCYTIFEVLKSCLEHGKEIKKNNEIINTNFVLASASIKKNRKRDKPNSISYHKNSSLSTGNLFKPTPNYKVVENSNSNYTNTSNSKISFTRAFKLIPKKKNSTINDPRKEYLPIINTNSHLKDPNKKWISGNATSSKFKFRDTFSVDKNSKNFGYTTSQFRYYSRKKGIGDSHIKKLSDNYDYREIFKYFNLINQN